MRETKRKREGKKELTLNNKSKDDSVRKDGSE